MGFNRNVLMTLLGDLSPEHVHGIVLKKSRATGMRRFEDMVPLSGPQFLEFYSNKDDAKNHRRRSGIMNNLPFQMSSYIMAPLYQHPQPSARTNEDRAS